jgi:hypothetical protein
MMADETPRDHSDEAEIEDLERVARDVLGLELDEVTRRGSELNMLGLQAGDLTVSQRLDSRTYFVQDTGGAARGEEAPDISDEDVLDVCRRTMEQLAIPSSEVGDEAVLTERMQAGQLDRVRGTMEMGEVRVGTKLARISRQIERLPVWSSGMKLSLTARKGIAFMELHWPEIPAEVIKEAHRLAYRLEKGWRPPEQVGVTVESAEAGILHSPAVSLVMDIYPAIRVIYTPDDERIGRKLTLYLDRHGRDVPRPREFDSRLLEEAATPRRSRGERREESA